MQKEVLSYANPNINYFAKTDIKYYINFLKITQSYIRMERRNQGYCNVDDFKLYNMLSRIEAQKHENKIKINPTNIHLINKKEDIDLTNASEKEYLQESNFEEKCFFE